MSIYYKYAPYGTKIIVLFYVDDCVYEYIYVALVKLVCEHSRKDILCEIPGICTLVHVNQDFPDERPLNFSILG